MTIFKACGFLSRLDIFNFTDSAYRGDYFDIFDDWKTENPLQTEAILSFVQDHMDGGEEQERLNDVFNPFI